MRWLVSCLGVRVASCDVTGDGVRDILTAPGPGGGPHVRIWSRTGARIAEIGGFSAYAKAFIGGVFIACGDVTGDGIAEIITGAGPGGGPHVRAWSLRNGSVTEVAGFFAYDAAFRGGVHVAAGDVTGDGIADIVTGAGAGGGPHVRVWSLHGGTLREGASFFAYHTAFRGGVAIAVGDTTGDGIAEIVTGAGPGGGPHVRVWSLRNGLSERSSFYVDDPTLAGGIFVASGDLNGDGRDEIVTSPGLGGEALIRVFSEGGISFGVDFIAP